MLGNSAAGGATATVNTQFNSVMYNENTSLWQGGTLGTSAGFFASIVRLYTRDLVASFVSNSARIPTTGPIEPFPALGTLNPKPATYEGYVNLGVRTIPAFIDPSWVFIPPSERLPQQKTESEP